MDESEVETIKEVSYGFPESTVKIVVEKLLDSLGPSVPYNPNPLEMSIAAHHKVRLNILKALEVIAPLVMYSEMSKEIYDALGVCILREETEGQ